MHDRPTARSFIAAFTQSWFAAMSGPLSVPLAISSYFVDNNIGFACVWAAAYALWRKERLAVMEAEKRLNGLHQQRATLEVKFPEDRAPFKLQDQRWTYWRFVIHNQGPAVAENVGVRLRLISPSPRVLSGVLDYPLTFGTREQRPKR
jgi:hypothetical protein